MPKDKTETHKRVVEAARAEFLEKGFEHASIRSIGQRAGITSAGLYRHFRDKEEMFTALVEPVIHYMEAWSDRHKKTKYDLVDKDADKDALFSETIIDMMKDLISNRRIGLKLLLCCAQGTKYEHFTHEFVEKNQKDFEMGISYMKSLGYPVKEVSKEELHMLLSAYFTACFEPVVHDYYAGNIEHYLETINEFFKPGWMKLMGLS